ncbi:MAG: hypothetical protein KC731_21235 [Myxococcales bacterium]|nr:hypothetical protein [Myxococcales bacterium]
MARWRRAESLIVRDDGRPEREIARFSADLGTVIPSQRRFLVSPNGQHLAHAATGGRAVVVRAAGGGEHRLPLADVLDFRFTGDGRLVASSAGEQASLDLATGAVEHLGRLDGVRWMEPCRDGVVLLRKVAGADRISRLDGQGRVAEVAEPTRVTRLMAARDGTRVAYTTPWQLHAVDFADRVPKAKLLGMTAGEVHNGEMSADGSQIAIVNHRALMVAEGDGPPRTAWVEAGIFAVWIEGEALVAASPKRAFFRKPGGDLELSGQVGLRNLRFARDGGGGVVLVRERSMLRWLPGREPSHLASMSKERQGFLLAAQRWAGGDVMWTGRQVIEDELDAEPLERS